MTKWFSRRLASRLPISNLPSAKSPGNSKPGKGKGRGSGADIQSTVTWHPTEKGANETLSNGNLTATGTAVSTNNYLKSTSGWTTSGKYYFEMALDSLTAAVNHPCFGIARFDLYDLGSPITKANCWTIWRGTGGSANKLQFNNNGTNITTPTQLYAVNSILMYAIDTAASKVWIGCDGVWSLSGNPSAGTNPIISAGIPSGVELRVLGYSAYSTTTVRFAQRSWTYPAPTGFTQLL